jgi:hypothetical protein
MSFNWVKDMRQDGVKLAEYTQELEARLDKATKELTCIAAGIVDSDIHHNNPSWAWDTKLKLTAARALERISKMPHRKRPYSSYF